MWGQAPRVRSPQRLRMLSRHLRPRQNRHQPLNQRLFRHHRLSLLLKRHLHLLLLPHRHNSSAIFIPRQNKETVLARLSVSDQIRPSNCRLNSATSHNSGRFTGGSRVRVFRLCIRRLTVESARGRSLGNGHRVPLAPARTIMLRVLPHSPARWSDRRRR
jgi:hypothetical protein